MVFSKTDLPSSSGTGPSPTASSEIKVIAGSSSDVAPAPLPDPRWPYLHRWSGSKTSLADTIGQIESPAAQTPALTSRLDFDLMDSDATLHSPVAMRSLEVGGPALKSKPPTGTEAPSATGTEAPSLRSGTLAPPLSSERAAPPLTIGVPPYSPTTGVPALSPSSTGPVAPPPGATGTVAPPLSATGPVAPPPSLTGTVKGMVAPAQRKKSVATGKELHQSSTQPPPLLGAWTKKLNFSSSTAYQKPPTAISNLDTAEDASRFPWAAKMNPATRNLYRAVEPVYLEDGTPKVTIPPHVLLQGLENQKEYVLGQFFRCSLPPGGLIYAIFNKLWGRNCKITIRKLGASSYLFHIPEESTRNWVLQRGLWHVDDCLMFVAPWTPEASLAIPEIKTIPVWVTLKNIPSILYSIRGISHIASGLGAPMATHKPRLDPVFMGEAKILVEVELNKAFPPKIAADDKNGVIWMIDVEYAWLPSTCSRCGQLGHKVRRCLQSGEPIVAAEANAPHLNVLVETTAVANTTPPLVPTKTSTAYPPNEFPPTDDVFKANDPPATQMIDQELESPPLSVPSGPRSYSAVVSEVLTTTPESLLAPSTAVVSTTQSTTHPTIISEEAIESPTLGAATPSTVTTDVIAQEKLSLIEPDLGSNRFASLGSPEEEEDSLDSDHASEPGDPLTPAGKRILRDRPVKPSTKAKEMHWQSTARGRGHRGRGGRG